GGPGLLLRLSAPVHRGIDVLLSGYPSQPLGDQLAHVGGARCAPTRFGLGNHISHARSRDATETRSEPFICALDAHVLAFFCRAATARSNAAAGKSSNFATLMEAQNRPMSELVSTMSERIWVICSSLTTAAPARLPSSSSPRDVRLSSAAAV